MVLDPGARRREYLSLPGGDVHVRWFGRESTPIVLLHDCPGSGATLVEMADALSAQAAVAILDLPGHGATTVEVDAGDPVAHAGVTVAAVLDSLGIQGAILAGTGAGALVAAAVAHTARDVCSLALLHFEPASRRLATAPTASSSSGPGLLIDCWWQARRAGLLLRANGLAPAVAVHDAAVDLMDRHDSGWAADGDRSRFSLGHCVDLPEWSPDGVWSTLGRQRPSRVTATTRSRRATGTGADGMVRHSYLSMGYGQLHIRHVTPAGPTSERAVVLLPSLPGSGAGMCRLLRALGTDRRVVALDYPGHGRSDPLAPGRHDLETYLDVIEQAVEDLDLGRVDVFGVHSGALLAALWARRHPERIASLALDGVPLAAAFEHYDLDRYLPDLTPDGDGHHVVSAWAMANDRQLWSPWYLRDAAHRRSITEAIGPAQTDWTIDLLRAASTYRLLYRLILTCDLEALGPPPEPVPTLLCRVHGDPLERFLDRVAGLFPGAVIASSSGVGSDLAAATTASVLADFFDQTTRATALPHQEHI